MKRKNATASTAETAAAPPLERPYSIKELETILEVKTSRIYGLISDGDLAPVIIREGEDKGRLGVMPSEVERYKKTRRPPGRPSKLLKELESETRTAAG